MSTSPLPHDFTEVMRVYLFISIMSATGKALNVNNMENARMHDINGSYMLVHQKWKLRDPCMVFRIHSLASCSLSLNGLKASKVYSSFCMRRLMERLRMTTMTLQFSFCCSVQINIEQLRQAR